MSETVDYIEEDGVAFITLDRPDAMNAINRVMRSELPAAVDRAAASGDVRCIVVAGKGGRAFCVGADLKEEGFDTQPAEFRQQRSGGRHWIAAFDRNPKPVVAAIHGYCLGGGLELALACDIRVASTDASFAFPETGFGVIPAAGGTQRIAHVVGLGMAMEMVLTGRRLSSEEALACGLVNRVCGPDMLMQTAREIATAIASRPPTATRFAKEAVRHAVFANLNAGLEREVDLASLLMSVDERPAGASGKGVTKP